MDNEQPSTFASFLLARALKDYFPKLQLVGDFSQNAHFSYDFIAPFSFDDQALQFLNDRIKELISEDLEITCHDMLNKVAFTMFQSNGEAFWCQLLKTQDPNELVSLVRVGNLYCLTSKCFDESSSFKGVVKLTSFEKITTPIPVLGQTTMWRISGVAADSANALKTLLKTTKNAESHDDIGKKLNLFHICDGEIVYTAQGAFALRALEEVCSNAYESQNYDFIRGNPHLLSKTLAKAYVSHTTRDISPRETKGLWLSKSFYRDESYRFVPYRSCKESLISSLHFIEKNVNISGVEGLWSPLLTYNEKKRGTLSMSYDALVNDESLFEFHLKKGKVVPKKFVLFYTDAFLELWEGPSVELMNVPMNVGQEIKKMMGWQDEVLLIKTSFFGSFERFLAFCLEKKKALPPTLSKEHAFAKQAGNEMGRWPEILRETGR